ncbi:MAG: translation elongation factor Ts [Desulfovibrio sp.]|jgi:elongation factor Ts|nr:translation elongation factor Ts [Desulfovibrio sp.]
MATITAGMVKELRERTGAGMMDCKTALAENGGDMEAAIDRLRQKGLSRAARKAGRTTSEGFIGCRTADDHSAAALVEVKCETDFVARGEAFRAFAAKAASRIFDGDPPDAGALELILGAELKNLIATLGENMSLGRFARLEAPQNGLVGNYVHSNGKIGVLVELVCQNPATVHRPELLELAHNLAMQVAAAGALARDPEDLDPGLVARERAVHRQKTLDEGKPEHMVDKIVDGRIRKFYEEVCLMEQPYIRDDKIRIKDLVRARAEDFGDALRVGRFVRLNLGEDARREE